jgi:hypothetical protein
MTMMILAPYSYADSSKEMIAMIKFSDMPEMMYCK